MVKKILLISLSNIGDVILTFPVLDILRRDFPTAELSLVVGPKVKSLLQDNPNIQHLYIFEKRQSWWRTILWIWSLRRERFDLVVDLRNTAIPFFLGARRCTSPFLRRVKGQHMRLQHLNRLWSVYPFERTADQRFGFYSSFEAHRAIDGIIQSVVGLGEQIVVVAPGAADRGKRWQATEFARLCDKMIKQYGVKVVLVGDSNDKPVVAEVCLKMAEKAVDLSGQLTLAQLGLLLLKAKLLITNDSASLHLASYLNIPTLVIFGPTDPKRYGPWAMRSSVVERKISCPACQSGSRRMRHECLEKVQAEDVLDMFQLKDGVVTFS